MEFKTGDKLKITTLYGEELATITSISDTTDVSIRPFSWWRYWCRWILNLFKTKQ